MQQDSKAWVSFCISTFKRPKILEQQLHLLAKQTFPYFEVVVSDNDPESSARDIVEKMHDARFKYFPNTENLGMIKSFNKSIERANTEYIVMITDDDPLEPDFLATCRKLYENYPGYSAYCGFLRKNKPDAAIEIIHKGKFIAEILDPGKTINQLWSSAVLRREDAIAAGLIPDYGAPHLSDHAFVAKVGNRSGGVVINRMFGIFTSHEANFSKSNFDNYVNGCKGFYTSIAEDGKTEEQLQNKKIAVKHLSAWFIANYFLLKKYYTLSHADTSKLAELDECAEKILKFKFMRHLRFKLAFKKLIFWFKMRTGLLQNQ